MFSYLLCFLIQITISFILINLPSFPFSLDPLTGADTDVICETDADADDEDEEEGDEDGREEHIEK